MRPLTLRSATQSQRQKADDCIRWSMRIFISVCSLPITSFCTDADLPENGLQSIADLMDASGTDKLFRHVYDRYYERYFREFRHKTDMRVLEIGADSGISLKVKFWRNRRLLHIDIQKSQVWSEYFTNATAIHGIAYRVSEVGKTFLSLTIEGLTNLF